MDNANRDNCQCEKASCPCAGAKVERGIRTWAASLAPIPAAGIVNRTSPAAGRLNTNTCVCDLPGYTPAAVGAAAGDHPASNFGGVSGVPSAVARGVDPSANGHADTDSFRSAPLFPTLTATSRYRSRVHFFCPFGPTSSTGPTDAETAYVAFGGFGVTPGHHVWKTTTLSTGGAGWAPAGVGIPDVPVNALAEFGLKDRKGALVGSVNANGPAAKAGIEPGDVIIEFNGKPVQRRDQLVNMVVNTKPGTAVPVKVMRDKVEKSLTITVDELDLDREGTRATRRENDDPDVSENVSFGLSLGVLSSDMARRLRVPSGTEGVVVTDVELGSPAQRAGISRGDVILQVNRRPVTSPREADRALEQVPSGGTAFLLILRNGQQNFVTVRKE